MNSKQCKNGHFYDPSKYRECPHCKNMNGTSSRTISVAMNETETVDVVRMGKDAQLPHGFTPNNPKSDLERDVEVAIKNPQKSKNLIFPDDEKTVGKHKRKYGCKPPVGWLVCVNGENFGDEFRLVSGKNFIGRSSSMQVCISKDNSVSREKHAIVVYDPKKNTFSVQDGESTELFYLNGDTVISSAPLKINDVLEIGETELMFIPCCSDAFTWENIKQKEQ